MMKSWAEQKVAIATAWDRFVAVDVPDEEEARVGRLFCVMMVLTFGLALALVLVFVIAMVRGLIDDPLMGWLEATFPLTLLPLSIVSLLRVKQGHVSSTSRWFVWVNFIGTALAVFVFDGINSPAWLLFFWPVALAGMFLRPVSAVRMAFGVLLYYGVLAVLPNYGIKMPVSSLSFDLYYFFTRAFGLLMLVATAGFVNYLSMSSVHQSMARTLQISQDLRGTQRTLERRVTERTDELSRRAEQFRAIAELNRAISSIPDLQTLLDTTVRLIAERLGYDHVGIFFVDPHGEWVVLRAASSEGGQRMLARGHRLRVGRQGIVGYVAETGLPRLAFSVGDDAVWFDNPDLMDTQSEIGLPLIARGQTTLGVLDIQTRKRAAFTEDDVEVLRILADGIAVAVTNTQSMMETSATLVRLERYQEQDALRAWRQALARRQMQIGYMFDSGFVYPVEVSTVSDVAAAQVMTDVTTQVTDAGQHLLLAPIHIVTWVCSLSRSPHRGLRSKSSWRALWWSS
jgi:putative methionine-R-sulfoxide reductase with GAF domain